MTIKKGEKIGKLITSENAREYQRRSVEARNRNTDARNMFLRLAAAKLKSDDGKEATRQEVIADVIIEQACAGDLQAAKFFFEITDQMPERNNLKVEVTETDFTCDD